MSWISMKFSCDLTSAHLPSLERCVDHGAALDPRAVSVCSRHVLSAVRRVCIVCGSGGTVLLDQRRPRCRVPDQRSPSLRRLPRREPSHTLPTGNQRLRAAHRGATAASRLPVRPNYASRAAESYLLMLMAAAPHSATQRAMTSSCTTHSADVVCSSTLRRGTTKP